jgi:hypothetical protein
MSTLVSKSTINPAGPERGTPDRLTITGSMPEAALTILVAEL